MKKNSRSVTVVVSFLIVVACAGGGDSSQPVSDQSTENRPLTSFKFLVERYYQNERKIAQKNVSIVVTLKQLNICCLDVKNR